MRERHITSFTFFAHVHMGIMLRYIYGFYL